MPGERILFIEDEAEDMVGTVNSLRRADYVLDIAENAGDALRKLRSSADSYTVVILDLMLPTGKIDAIEGEFEPDWNMPEKTGLFVLSQMARRYGLLPVIVATAIRTDLTGMEQPARCAVLTKPVRISDLLEAIAKFT